MAVAFDNSTLGTIAAEESSLTFAHTNTGSNLTLLVFVARTATQTVSTVTYAGAAMTLLNPPGTLGPYDSLKGHAVYYKFAPATGANNVVVTMSAGITAGTRVYAVAACFSNTHQTAIVTYNNQAIADGTFTNPWVTSVTTTNVNQMLVDCIIHDTDATTKDSGQTQMEEASAGFNIEATYKLAASAGSNSMTYGTGGLTADASHIVVVLGNPNITTSLTESITETDTFAGLRTRQFTIDDSISPTDTIVSSIGTEHWVNQDEDDATWTNQSES